jgi:hypothetical protein
MLCWCYHIIKLLLFVPYLLPLLVSLLFATHPWAITCNQMRLQLQIIAYATTFQIWMKFGIVFD